MLRQLTDGEMIAAREVTSDGYAKARRLSEWEEGESWISLFGSSHRSDQAALTPQSSSVRTRPP
jgi:hypothetical protein